MTLAWHWTGDTLRDGRPIPPVGETLRYDGELEICKHGLHASERVLDAIQYAPGPVVHRVRVGGRIIREDDKLCAHERTILWSHRVSDDLLRGFARQQARSVLHLWDAPEIVKRYLETGDESIRKAAGDAAWAASDAASDARAAARGAWAAARDAARAAARDATRAATRAAAWAAAWDARAATRAAAWAAAWDARDARDAARDAANIELERLILVEANKELEPA